MENKTVYLTMVIGGELFAVSVDRTREILDSITTTRLPNMPDYMAGVINVRGSAIPVVDLRLKLEFPVREGSRAIPVIVLEIPGSKGEVLLVGVMVDEVREVVEVSDENREPAPSMGKGLTADFLAGMYQHGERLVMVLDTEKLFSEHEQGLFSGIGETSEALDGNRDKGALTVKDLVRPGVDNLVNSGEAGKVDIDPKADVETFKPAEKEVSETVSRPIRKKPVRRKKKLKVEVEMKIAQQLENAGITLEELSAKIDMDKRTLKRLVTKGGPNTTIATLKRIAEGIGCHWKDLAE